MFSPTWAQSYCWEQNRVFEWVTGEDCRVELGVFRMGPAGFPNPLLHRLEPCQPCAWTGAWYLRRMKERGVREKERKKKTERKEKALYTLPGSAWWLKHPGESRQPVLNFSGLFLQGFEEIYFFWNVAWSHPHPHYGMSPTLKYMKEKHSDSHWEHFEDVCMWVC